MSIVLFILSAALMALSLVAAGFYGAALWRILRVGRRLPTARDGLRLAEEAPPERWPSVCVIVPAHNEQDVIGDVVRSLLAQDYPNLRIVLALDRCTDDTERIARGIVGDDARVEIMVISHCPEDWSGKTNALWRARHDSRAGPEAELLLFADADTTFDSSLVRASVALLLDRGLDLLSLLSRLTHEQWYERRIQPAAAFELVRQYPLDSVNRAERPRAFANGQFMLFRRELYERIGGHESVKDHLLEDIALARLLDKRKRRIPSKWGVFLSGDGTADVAAGMLRCRMYRDFGAFRRGWKRIFTEAAHRRPKQLLQSAWRLRLTAVILPTACALAIAVGVWDWAAGQPIAAGALIGCGALGLALMAWAVMAIYRDQRAPLLMTPLYPLGAWWVANLLTEAARDLHRGERTVWGGREYVRTVGR